MCYLNYLLAYLNVSKQYLSLHVKITPTHLHVLSFQSVQKLCVPCTVLLIYYITNRLVVCRRAHVLFQLFVFVCV
jgi:hypothetical protein